MGKGATLKKKIAHFVKQLYKDRISETHKNIPDGKWNKNMDKTWFNYIIGKKKEKNTIDTLKKLVGMSKEHAKKLIEAVKQNHERSKTLGMSTPSNQAIHAAGAAR